MKMKNLLITTALVATLTGSGLALAHDMGTPSGPEAPPHPPFMDVLPKDKAEQFHEIMKQAFAKNMVLYEQKHELRDQLRAIITAPKFDKDAFIAKSEELHKFEDTLHDKTEANMHEAFANGLVTLSQEQRQAIAASMEKMHEEHEDHGHEGMWGHGEHEGEHGPHGDHLHGDHPAPPPPPK